MLFKMQKKLEDEAKKSEMDFQGKEEIVCEPDINGLIINLILVLIIICR